MNKVLSELPMMQQKLTEAISKSSGASLPGLEFWSHCLLKKTYPYSVTESPLSHFSELGDNKDFLLYRDAWWPQEGLCGRVKHKVFVYC